MHKQTQRLNKRQIFKTLYWTHMRSGIHQAKSWRHHVYVAWRIEHHQEIPKNISGERPHYNHRGYHHFSKKEANFCLQSD